MKPTDHEIERLVLRLIDDHLPEKQRHAARQWLKRRIKTYNEVEDLG